MTPCEDKQGDKKPEEAEAELSGGIIQPIFAPMPELMAVKILARHHLTVSTAESCTGGLLAKRITDISGASEVFEMGLVTYANRIKTQLLHVPEAILAEYGAVSEQVAILMAKNARELAGSDFGIGITGIAGPNGGSPEKPVGLVYICLAGRERVWLVKMLPDGQEKNREEVRQEAATRALEMLLGALEELLGKEGG